MAKYCAKEMQCRALDQKRYFLQTWCDNNLGVVYLVPAPGLPQVVDDCPF